MKKMTLTKSLTFFIAIVFGVNFGFGQEIASFSSVQNSGCSGTISINSNVSGTGICRSTNITENSGLTYNSRDWTTSTSLDLNDYLEWSLTPNSGYQIDLSSMLLRYDKSLLTGPDMVDIHADTGSGFSSIFSDASVSSIGENITIDLSSLTGITGTITFRLYAFNSSSALGSFDIEQRSATNKGVIINGAVSALGSCLSVSTWDGSVWFPSAPDLTTVAIIDGSYNTTTEGSITACSLIVNSSGTTPEYTLTVTDGYFVEVQNDVTVNGNINLSSLADFVQIDDSGEVNGAVLTTPNKITVAKKTSPLNNWYEYTYWSSPVSGETIENGLFESQAGRRYSFNASLFNDALMETGNNDILVEGQDDVDDEGDDWAWVSGTTEMIPGIGYAATHSEAFFILPPMATLPFQFDYTFDGPFNTGIINVPANRNDATILDNNWNLIGNPYPSTISASDFLLQNTYNASTNPTGVLEGAIYLWSQNTAPSGTTNGNQNLNFSTSDYAVMNSTGGTKGGDTDRNADGSVDTNDDVIPYIASGQAFFVLFSDMYPSNTGIIEFNNGMRRKSITNSNLLYKNTNSKNTKSSTIDNKIWINLTSDNGVFNQILVGYTENATNNDDGASYDAPKNTGSGTAAILYSTIEDSNKKFAIQGKASNSLDEDETIKLGFSTSIDVATLYKLSIDHLQGVYLNSNTIYLKDNLLNKTHDLTICDYTFTSEVGEFNERFEIAFTAEALSTDNNVLDTKSLKIVQLDNDNIQFRISNNLSIKSVTIFDLLGRQLYNLKGNSSTETYKLSNLNEAVYIAKVELSNGTIITKKSIKN